MSQRLARNALYLTVASIGQKLLAFVYFLMLARVLEPEKTGQYTIALSLVTAFYVVADLGVSSVVIRDVAKKAQAEALPLVRRALAFKLPFTLLALILSNLAAWMLGYEPQARLLVALAGATLFLDSISLLYFGVLRGLHVLKYEALDMFIGQSITLMLGFIVLFVHPSLPLLILVLILGSLSNVIISTGQVVRRLGMNAIVPEWSKSEMKKIFAASLPFFLAATFVKLFSTLDVQFLKFFWGNATVGIYTVAYKFTYAFQFLPLAFIAALYPGMSALVGKKDIRGLAALFEQAVRYMLLLSVPLAFGIAFVATEAVQLVGPTYANAVPVLSFLPFVLIPSFLDFPIGSLLNSAGKQNIQTALFGITLVINFFFDLYLVPLGGMIGAGIASIISLTLLVAAGFYFVPRVIYAYRLRRLAWIALPIVVSGLVMRIAAHYAVDALAPAHLSSHVELVCILILSAFVYFVALLLTRAITPTDLQSLRKLFQRQTVEHVEDEAM